MFVKILEPEERTAALINLTANMLYLENNAQSQYSEVRILGLSYDIFNTFLFLVNACGIFTPVVLNLGVEYTLVFRSLHFTMGSEVCWAKYLSEL